MPRSPSAELEPVCEFGESRATCVLNEILDSNKELHHAHQVLCTIVKGLHAQVVSTNAKINRVLEILERPPI